eukprot:scaffold79700_cov45-Cyclotella_meneghiniana.AAC.3
MVTIMAAESLPPTAPTVAEASVMVLVGCGDDWAAIGGGRAWHDRTGRKTRVLMSVASGQKACLQGSDDKCPVSGTCRDMSQDIYNLGELHR